MFAYWCHRVACPCAINNHKHLELGKEKVHNAKRNQSENSPFKMQKPNNKLVQSEQRSNV
jgi:hypothetical protein